MNDYRGVYYNLPNEHQFFEGGAHFKYSDLYKRLFVLANRENSANKVRGKSGGSKDKEKNKVTKYIYKKRFISLFLKFF